MQRYSNSDDQSDRYDRDPYAAADTVKPDRQSRRRTVLITVLIILLAVGIGIAITVSQHRGGPLPTWDEIYSALELTEPVDDHADDLAVHFIDVGQGDSIFIQTPDGQSLLIDAGENGNEEIVSDYIRQYGDDTLEYVVATHPHSDHIGALDGVIGSFTVTNVIMPRLTADNTPTTAVYRDFLTAVKRSKAKAIAAKPGYTFSLGEGVCTVLAPSEQTDDLNNLSVVLRLDWGETSFLFTGDAERAEEKTILDGKYADLLDVDVLKMGHHGSRTSTSAAFLKKVTPDYCVISCAAGNDYGHPHSETLLKLEKIGQTPLRTDELGSIRFYSDGQTLTVESDRNAVHD